MPAPQTAPPLTVHLLKAFYESAPVQAAVADLLAKRIHSAVVTAHVHSYTAPLLAQYGIVEDKHDGDHCTDPERVYLCSNEQAVAAYFAACGRAHAANGYAVPDGCCPALMAQEAVRKAEGHLLKLAADVLGVDCRYTSLENRDKALDLFCSPPRK